MQRTILDFDYIYYFMIIMDWCMIITRMMPCSFTKKTQDRLDTI